MGTEIFLAPIENFYYNSVSGKYVYHINNIDYTIPYGFYIHKINDSSVKIIQHSSTHNHNGYIQLQFHIDIMWAEYEQKKTHQSTTTQKSENILNKIQNTK